MKLFSAQHQAARTLVLLIILLVLARLVSMAVLPLMDTTEARYAEIARKMVVLGDWITPWADDNLPFWGKPPLSFWLTAATLFSFGVSEFSARIPHFLCALFIGFLVWDMALRQEGRRTAVLAISVLAGSALFLVSSGAVMTDMALVLGTTAALYGFWTGIHGSTSSARSNGSLIFFVGLAIGLLAKGPLVLVLAGLPISLWILLERRWKTVLTGIPWISGILLVAVLVLPWYWFAEQKTPGFLDYFLIGEHFKRFVEPGWTGDLYGRAHNFPLGTIWLFALIAFLPWPFTFLVVKWESRGKQVEARDRSWVRYTLLWALMPLVFFTASRNIIWTYALPSLPAASLFMGGWLAARSRRAELWVAGGLAIMFALTVGAGAGAMFFPHLLDGATAKAVSVAYLGRRRSGETLYFLQSRPFSASFYSENAARQLRPEELESALSGKSGFIAYPKNAQPPKLPSGVVEEPAGDYGRFRLLRVQRIDQLPRR